MFYFHDPLINTTPPPVTPPAMSRVVEAPVPPPITPVTPPKGWRWANAKSSSSAAAPGTVAGGDVDPGKKRPLFSPATPSPKPIPMQQPVPVTPCSAVPANAPSPSPSTTPAWQPPKGYVLWMGHHSAAQTKAQPSAAPTAARPAWSIVSWRNLAPRSITGTREEAISQVESDLATAGVHHLDIQVYDAVQTIVALKAKA